MRDHHAVAAFISDRVALPYGGFAPFDGCIRFADAAMAAQTGAGFISRLSHTWTTQRGAARVLRRVGGLRALIDTVLTPVAPSMAARGDIGLAPGDGWTKLALVVIEGDTIVGVGASGARRATRDQLLCAWSLGA